jgi:hypothetical protein
MKHLLALMLLCVGCGTPSKSGSHLYQPASVDPDAVRKVCAMERSCLSKPQFDSGAACVAQMEYGLASGIGVLFGPSVTDLQRYVECVGKSNDCAGVLACASVNHDATWCPPGRYASCDGNKRIGCVAGWGLELEDCAQLGQTCVATSDSALCSTTNHCDSTTQVDRCDGSSVVECNSGSSTEQRLDCRDLDAEATCAVISDGNGGGYPGCVKKGNASCGADGGRCDGARAIACTNGFERVIDCGSYGNVCALDANGRLSCVPPPTATDCNFKSPDSCDGDSLRICVNGRWVATSCTSIGLKSCISDDSGARCVP